MNEELYQRLRKSGVAEPEARDIAKSYVGAAEERVDVDQLTKAMQDVASSFEADSSAVDAAVQEASDIVDAVTRGADVMLQQQREQGAALAKGLLALADEVRSLRTTVQAGSASLAKSMTVAGNEPVARRSLAVVPAPGDAQAEGEAQAESEYHAVLQKALGEMPNASSQRQHELRKAVSMLEVVGFSGLNHVRSQYGL